MQRVFSQVCHALHGVLSDEVEIFTFTNLKAISSGLGVIIIRDVGRRERRLMSDNDAGRESIACYVTNVRTRLPFNSRFHGRRVLTRRVFALGGLGAIPLLGADVWTKKPSEWSGKDIQRILTKSPWAKEATVALNLAGGGMDGGRGGGMGGPPGGGMGGPPAGGGMGGPPGGMDGPGGGGGPQLHAIVRWESALPIRLALKKEDALSRDQYLITVTGFPETGRRPQDGGSQPVSAQAQNRMKEGARLERKGKDPIPAASAEMAETGASRAMQFLFRAGADPIEAQDKEVQFVASVGPMQIRAKFALQEMVYEGKLEL